MRLNRREFVRIGTLGVVGAVTTSCGSCDGTPDIDRPKGTLNVRIKGLCIVERMPTFVTAHLVDGGQFPDMGPHEPFLSVPNAVLDTNGTTAASQPDPGDSNSRAFDLRGKTVTLNTGITGPPDVAFNDDPIIADIPPNDGWKSLKLSAVLSTLTGATRITDRSKFYANLRLDHGRLESTFPADSQLGRGTVWKFTRKLPTGQVQDVTTQVMTNALVCSVPVSGTKATFMIDGQPVVVNVNQTADVLVKNLPPEGTPGVCKGTRPCVEHLHALYSLVDAQFTPDVTVIKTPPPGTGVEPNYCPPGSI